jgi:hypothetical protein
MIPALSGVELSSGIDRRTGRRGEDGGAGELFHDALGRATGAPEVRERPPESRGIGAPGVEAPPKPEDGASGEADVESELEGADVGDAEEVPEGEGGPAEPKAREPSQRVRVEGPIGEAGGDVAMQHVPTVPVPARPKGGGADRPPVVHGSGAESKPGDALGGVTGSEDATEGTDETPSDSEPIQPKREPRNPAVNRVLVGAGGRTWVGQVMDRQPGSGGLGAVDAPTGEASAEGRTMPVTVPSATAQDVVPRSAAGATPARTEVVTGAVGAPVAAHGSGGGEEGAAWREERGASAGSQGAPPAGASVKAGRVETVVGFEAPGAAGAEGAEARAAMAQGGESVIGVKLGGAQKLSMGSAGTAGRGVQDAQSAGFEGAVTRGFSAVMRQNGGSVVIRLIPETLGPLRISMTLDKTSVSVMLDASTPQAHELLTSNLGSLRQSLESQGLRVDRMGVTLTQSGPPSPGAPGADSAAHHRGSEDPGGGGQDAAGGRSRGHSDEHSRDRRGGAHADPTPPFGSFSELIEASGVPMRFVATA